MDCFYNTVISHVLEGSTDEVNMFPKQKQPILECFRKFRGYELLRNKSRHKNAVINKAWLSGVSVEALYAYKNRRKKPVIKLMEKDKDDQDSQKK